MCFDKQTDKTASMRALSTEGSTVRKETTTSGPSRAGTFYLPAAIDRRVPQSLLAGT